MNALSLLFLFGLLQQQAVADYDPLVSAGKVTIKDMQFQYGADDRVVPIKVYLPESSTPAAVLLFSHGLGGSRDGGAYLGKHWAGRGYVVVAMQHAGSDSAVWKDAPLRQRLDAMKKAANWDSLQGRVNDVGATLDQLTKWNDDDADLKGRLDLSKVGMSGHSFGAVTTQAVSGQNYGRLGQKLTDKRINAAIAFSPSMPNTGNVGRPFEKVSIPWLLMTGTNDTSVINRTTVDDRLQVYKELPAAGHFYELVLFEAEHAAFADETRIGAAKRNPNHHKVIQALSTAFWDTYLLKKPDAKTWLTGESAKALLEPNDEWFSK